MNRPTLLASSLWLALAATAHAETAADASASVNELERVQVTAMRAERAIADVPNTVDVIERERMDELLIRDLKDLFRYEPGITVGSNFGRFGLGDIRVRIQTDGIPVSDAFSIGSFSSANPGYAQARGSRARSHQFAVRLQCAGWRGFLDHQEFCGLSAGGQGRPLL